MRAQKKAGQSALHAFITAYDVADGINMCLHAGSAHPAKYFVTRGTLLVRKTNSRQLAGVLGVMRQGIATIHDAAGIEWQGWSSGMK